jgi:plastocyanin
VFKSWQIFVFSLVPLALVFAGVIICSYHGTDSSAEVYPTAAPAAASSSSGSSSSSTPTAGAAAAPGALTLTAKNLAYDKRSLTASPNTQVTLTLDNQDAGVAHNFSIYTNNKATTKIFTGDLVTGPDKKTYSFKTPAAGTCFYRCDVHPDQMTGTFSVK